MDHRSAIRDPCPIAGYQDLLSPRHAPNWPGWFSWAEDVSREAEIATGKEQIDTKTGELADTGEKNANDKQNLEGTKNHESAGLSTHLVGGARVA